MQKKYLLPAAIFCITVSYAQEYAVSNIKEELKKKANAVIRKNQQDITIKSIDQMETRYSKVVTVLNQSGAEMAYVSIPYDKLSKPSQIKVTVLDENGKQIKTYSKSDFKDFSHGENYTLYTDDRILFLNPEAVSYPYTVITEYTQNSGNTIFFPSFVPFYSYKTSLEKASINIKNISGINLRSKVYSNFIATPTEQKTADGISYSYANIPAIENEIKSPDLDELLPKVLFSLDQFSLEGKKGDFKDWNSFGKWYYNSLLQPSSVLTEDIKKEVAALNLQGSIEDKVKTLYQYMQNKTRYIFVAIGIGGWQPMPADDVRKKSYGDCKALSNYMKTLLDAAGIKSYYAIINSDASIINFDEDFPRMGGNHAILMVPTEKDNIWLENTSQKIAFNHLSYSTTARNVLAVDENGIKLMKTPVYDADKNRSIMQAEITLNSEGGINGKSKFNLTGWQYDMYLVLDGLSNKEAVDALKNRFSELNYETAGINNLKNDRNTAALSFDFDYQTKTYSKKIGQDLLFRVIPFYELTSINNTEERKLPFENAFAYKDDYEIAYNLPAGYKVSDIPQPVSMNSTYGNYSLKVSTNDKNQIIVKRQITINKGNYPKEQFVDYLAFRKKIVNADNSKILITKS
ncbi:DUF3857 domain-containing protein [Elizabethkingia meningoseptica]|uniref:DUF3857 domain-containing protein n=1 Tax=Elizabethkingia meningoseptica TaxID=238 RepID=UPI003891F6E1